MRGISWLLVLLAMAIFTVGCDQAPSPPPSGAIDAATDLDVHQPPLEEQEAEEQAAPAVDEAMEPADAPEEESEEVDTDN